MGAPIPISAETSGAIVSLLRERDIAWWPSSTVARLDPGARVAHLADGRTLPYDLFLGIPVHRAPPVVVEAGLTEDGWIPVDPATFATRFDDVFAVGDVTSAPVPRAGIIAEGEATTVAEVLLARFGDRPPPGPYQGAAVCYIEMGDGRVGRVDVNFLAGDAPTADFSAPSLEIAAEKRAFGASRRARWFGSGVP
jgi:sulfide:quinone oxidoreductase